MEKKKRVVRSGKIIWELIIVLLKLPTTNYDVQWAEDIWVGSKKKSLDEVFCATGTLSEKNVTNASYEDERFWKEINP